MLTFIYLYRVILLVFPKVNGITLANSENNVVCTTVYGKFSQVKIETRGRGGMLPFGFTLVSSREVHPP